MGTEFQFHSWRVFVLVCFLPSVVALAGLVFMPESPRYLLEVTSLCPFCPFCPFLSISDLLHGEHTYSCHKLQTCM